MGSAPHRGEEDAMDLAQRVQSLLEREHAELRQAIEEAEVAVRDLEEGRREWIERERLPTPAPTERRYGEPPARNTTPAPAARPRSTIGLRRGWDRLRQALSPHMERERSELFPLCLARGDGERERAEALVRELLDEHRELASLLAEARREGRRAYPVRNEIERVARLFEAHTRIEEGEVFPQLLGPDAREATPVPVQRTAADISRALRSRRPEPEPEPEPEPAPGVFGRLRRLFER